MAKPREVALATRAALVLSVTLGLVAAVLLARGLLLRWRADARESMCASQIRCCALSLLMYADHNGGRLPPVAGDDWVIPALPYRHSLHEMACSQHRQMFEGPVMIFDVVGQELPDSHRDPSDILALMKKKGLPLSSYVMPQDMAGAKLDELPPDAILLREPQARHRGRALAARCDGSVRPMEPR